MQRLRLVTSDVNKCDTIKDDDATWVEQGQRNSSGCHPAKELTKQRNQPISINIAVH